MVQWETNVIAPVVSEHLDRIEGQGRRRAGAGPHLPVPGVRDRGDARSSRGGPRRLPPLVGRDDLLPLRSRVGHGRLRETGGVLHAARRRAAPRPAPRRDQHARQPRSSTVRACPTRRSSRSCASCSRRVPRRPTGPPRTCSSACSRTPRSSTEVRADRSLRPAGHRGGTALGAAAHRDLPRRSDRHRARRSGDADGCVHRGERRRRQP